MNILTLFSNTNSKGKHDATGAFIPEARRFALTHGQSFERLIGVRCVGVKKSVRRERTLEAIHAAGSRERLDAIAFFGHGWPQGIQFGITRKDISALCDVLEHTCNFDVKIVLYACLAAENDKRDKDHANVGPGTDGGFADLLRDELARKGFQGWVDAHKTAGHTTWNPYVVRFRCDAVHSELYGAVGGSWLVEPGSESWGSWVRALKNEALGLRYRFPFMRELEIKTELAD